MKKIYNELARIQKELKAPKNLYTTFGNYNYRNAEGILESVKPLLNGLVLLINDEPVMIGNRFYIKATVTLTDGEESVVAVAYAREDETKKGMDGCQITGACSSYARKYALNALLMIDDSKDSDDDSLSPKNPANSDKNIELQPVQNDFTPPKSASATVETGNKVPEVKNEAEDLLKQTMKQIRETMGTSVAENNKWFKERVDAIVKLGLAPKKSLKEYTVEEAAKLIETIYQRFGGEIG